RRIVRPPAEASRKRLVAGRLRLERRADHGNRRKTRVLLRSHHPLTRSNAARRSRLPAPPREHCRRTTTLLHVEQLHIEYQGGVGRNRAAGAGRAIAQVGRNRELALAADAHALHALVPALDHLAAAELKLEWLAAIQAAVELE